MSSTKKLVIRLSLSVTSMATLLLLCLRAVSPAEADPPFSIYLPLILHACPAPAVPATGSWLEYVNFYRATACLPPVSENPAWSDGDRKHARYIVKNDILQHDEDPNNPWYTPEGRTAAKQSNIMASSGEAFSDWQALELWMQGPFHAVGILDPRLTQVGYGSYREADGGYQMGAALNVIAGISYTVSAHYPVFWPGQGTTVPLRLYGGGETPNPLASCPGYATPSGLPIILQLGSGNVTPAVSAASISAAGQPLERCVYDETSYTNPDSSLQSLGRSVLGSRDAIVLVPRLPLSAGWTYYVSITANGTTYAWTFSVSSTAASVQSHDIPGEVK